jgi:hypothetical protein
MTGWDILNEIMKNFPPIAATAFLVVVAVIFVVGFSKYGFNFLKYGFSQKEVDDLSKKIDGLSGEFKSEIGNLRTELHREIGNLRTEFHTELETIKVNHFGHLKNFLCELTSILLDKNVINNTDKARLDNQLRDM